MEKQVIYTECQECDEPIITGLYDIEYNVMSIKCPACGDETDVDNWYDNWEDGELLDEDDVLPRTGGWDDFEEEM